MDIVAREADLILEDQQRNTGDLHRARRMTDTKKPFTRSQIQGPLGVSRKQSKTSFHMLFGLKEIFDLAEELSDVRVVNMDRVPESMAVSLHPSHHMIILDGNRLLTADIGGYIRLFPELPFSECKGPRRPSSHDGKTQHRQHHSFFIGSLAHDSKACVCTHRVLGWAFQTNPQCLSHCQIRTTIVQ